LLKIYGSNFLSVAALHMDGGEKLTEKRRKLVYYGFVGLVIILIALFFIKHRNKIFRLIFPFILAMVISYMAERPVAYLEQLSFGKKGKKLRRSQAILIVYIIFALGIVTIGLFIIPAIVDNLKELMDAYPEINARINEIGEKIIEFFQSRNLPSEIISIGEAEFRKQLAALEALGKRSLSRLLSSLAETLSVFFDGILSFLIAYYFLKDKQLIADSLLSIFPCRWRPVVAEIASDINRIISYFISGQLLVAFLVGIIEALGLSLMGIKYPVVLGTIGGISNIIPVVGPIIGAVPAVAFALLMSPYKALLVVLLFIGVQQLDNNFLTPKIVESRLGLHPVATIAVILAGGVLYGLLGILFAVPVTAILVSIVSRILRAVSRP